MRAVTVATLRNASTGRCRYSRTPSSTIVSHDPAGIGSLSRSNGWVASSNGARSVPV